MHSLPENKSNPNVLSTPVLLLILLVIIIGGLTLYRNLADQRYFELAHSAYRAGDCERAIPIYEQVIHSFNPLNVKQLKTIADAEQTECNAYQEIVAVAEQGDPGQILISASEFVNTYPESPLATVAYNLMLDLLKKTDWEDLATPEMCSQPAKYLNFMSAADRQKQLPELYYACGESAYKENKWNDAVNWFKRIIIDFPSHAKVEQIETRLIDDPNICTHLTELENDPVFLSRPAFRALLYNHCGNLYTSNNDIDQAIQIYETLYLQFPEDPLAITAQDQLTILYQQKAAISGLKLPAPDRSGEALSGVSEVLLMNNSPTRLKVIFSGIESYSLVLDECASCRDFLDNAPTFCPEIGPSQKITLAPGTYQVTVIPLPKSGLPLLSGTWELADQTSYSNCFMTVKMGE
jgi:tetratricopeptide (TPR) repeat protein